ncbi:uncharacterized protein LOC123553330 [Mercenaria mercenaria]|uniref:uncharacterized protein LOC123553330 n=1 Tax=Mercenaria mercenaria TaxID=6596 RepID=UPI00234F6E5D|nr:uncharacterized protein LOC123553330 [Mercenaria mercenaria]
MWKLAFIVSCLLFCLIEAQEVVPVPGHGALKGYCNTNSDCGQKECCVSFPTPRRKYDVAEPSAYIRQFAKGKCEKHGKSGSECLLRHFSPMPKYIFYHSCPCSDGHLCRRIGQFISPLRELGICEEHCTSSANCGLSECCVSSVAVRGKRAPGGYCKPMGKRDSECLVSNGSGRPHRFVYHSCPCENPMTCVETFGYSEIGRCGHIQG